MNSGSFSEQVSLIHARGLLDHSVSNHLAPTVVALSCYPSARQLPVSPVRLRHRSAGSSGLPGRIEFLIVQTGRSPPAALHHASLRRSCIRLQAGEHMPEEDLHLSDHARSQAHRPPALAAWSFNFHLTSTRYRRSKRPSALAAGSLKFKPTSPDSKVQVKIDTPCG